MVMASGHLSSPRETSLEWKNLERLHPRFQAFSAMFSYLTIVPRPLKEKKHRRRAHREGTLRTQSINRSISAFPKRKNLAGTIIFMPIVLKSIITLWLHHTIRKTNIKSGTTTIFRLEGRAETKSKEKPFIGVKKYEQSAGIANVAPIS